MRTAASLAALLLVAGCPDLVQCVTDFDCYYGQICDPRGNCVAPDAGSTGGTSGSASGGNTGESGGSTGGVTGATTTGGSSGSATAGCPAPASGTTRALATIDSVTGAVWDVTNPPGQAIIGSAFLQQDVPTAVAVAPDGEILVLLDTAGLVAFDGSGNYLGQIEVPVPAGSFQGGNGLAVLPEGSGAPLVAVCGDQVTAFRYDGPSSFSSGKVFPTALWSGQGGLNGCFPGPCNTLFAASGNQLQWYDALSGNAHGSGTFAQSPGQVQGGAVAPNGDVLIVGDDGSSNGFVALLSGGGICQAARSGGACTLTCNGTGQNVCVAHDPTLAQTPLHQAASLPDGTFLVTAGTANTPAMDNIFHVDPGNALAVSTYLTASSGTDFYGLVVSPQPL